MLPVLIELGKKRKCQTMLEMTGFYYDPVTNQVCNGAQDEHVRVPFNYLQLVFHFLYCRPNPIYMQCVYYVAMASGF